VSAKLRQTHDDLRMPAIVDHASPDLAWQSVPPTMGNERVTVRGLLDTDAAALFALCAKEPVGRFIWPPPSTSQHFEAFIEWARHQQQVGRQVCCAIVPPNATTPAGFIQVRPLDARFVIAEWGFIVAEQYWGSGLFPAAAQLVVDFLFDVVGVRRLEARTVVTNVRANGALRKLGAVNEGRLRKGFRTDDRCYDQFLWSILYEDWAPHTLAHKQLH
jgi:ribosomal-protein-alanine N-acetyltransferase